MLAVHWQWESELIGGIRGTAFLPCNTLAQEGLFYVQDLM